MNKWIKSEIYYPFNAPNKAIFTNEATLIKVLW